MPDHPSELERYYDNQLGPAERAAIDRHVSACPKCRKSLAELASLSAALQNWALSPALSRLARPPALPFRRTQRQQHPGLAGWLVGAAIIILLFVTRAVFELSALLAWLSGAALVAVPSGLGQIYGGPGWLIWPVWLARLSLPALVENSAQWIAPALALLLPSLLHGLALGAFLAVYFTWLRLTWFTPVAGTE